MVIIINGDNTSIIPKHSIEKVICKKNEVEITLNGGNIEKIVGPEDEAEKLKKGFEAYFLGKSDVLKIVVGK